MNARALVISPPRADIWMNTLDEGRWPETYGFHVFQDCELGEHRTITGYVLAPRWVDEFDDATRSRVLCDIERRIAKHVPEFSQSVRYRRLLDPAEYEAMHRLSPALSHEIPTADSDVPSIESGVPGLFHIGNAVAPPGEHANAAMLSGQWAASPRSPIPRLEENRTWMTFISLWTARASASTMSAMLPPLPRA